MSRTLVSSDVGRLPGDDVNRAADRVAPVKRPLRPPQDFDAFDVQEIGKHHRRASEIDAVEMNSGTRIGTDDVLLVPMPRMVTCAAPVCCEIISVGAKPARPSTV